jgi:hypothetical protein
MTELRENLKYKELKFLCELYISNPIQHRLNQCIKTKKLNYKSKAVNTTTMIKGSNLNKRFGLSTLPINYLILIGNLITLVANTHMIN